MKILSSPLKINLSKHTLNLVWLSTFMSLIPLALIVSSFISIILLLIFVLVTKVLPQNWWTPTGRLFLFFILMLLAATQFGDITKEAGTAVLMGTMIVKYAEMKNLRDVHIMSLFNLVAPFIAFLQNQTIPILIVGLVAIIITLATMSSTTESIKEGRSSRVILFSLFKVCVKFIVILPLVILLYLGAPRVDNPLWGGSGPTKSKIGFSDNMDVSQWSELFSDLSTAFRVRYDDNKIPPRKDLYFKGITLWTFDGSVWSSTPSNHEIQEDIFSPELTDKISQHSYSISYEHTDSNRLFFMDTPIYLPKGVSRTSDGQYFYNIRKNKIINVEWSSGNAAYEYLPVNQRLSALQLPEDKNPQTLKMAKDLRSKYTNDRDYLNAVLNLYRTDFEYSFSPPPVGKHTVDDFLFDTRVGFCTHYASSFVVLMRAGGIPARVINGYQGGEASYLGDYLRVRQADAHAWAEVWIDNKWIRVDPTSMVTIIRDRDDIGWNLMSESYQMADWMKDIWERWFLYYDEASRDEVISNTKKAIEKGRSNSNKLFFIIPIIIIAILSILIASLKFKNNDISTYLNKWLLSWGIQFKPGDSWNDKIEKISEDWDSINKDELISITNLIRDHLYGDKDLDVRKIKIRLRNLKRLIKKKI